MKIDEIRGKSDNELDFDRKKLQRELFDLRFKAATETSANPSRINEARRAVARIHTILHERRKRIRGQEPRTR
jgi:large subunit ribosomal protein L29